VAFAFVSYRTDDEPGSAALIERELSRRFGSDNVFRASRSITPGDDFERAILATLRHCRVLLAVIGPRWLNVADEHGRRKIDNEQDWVRREIGEALGRGIRVIPILIGGTPRLSTNALPGEIEGLGRCQHLRLRHDNVEYDLARIIDELVPLAPTSSASALGAVEDVPELPPAYIVRNRELDQLIRVVLDPGTADRPVAVFGIGGCGKSVLAAALARDPRVQAAFPDGVAWVRVGRECRPIQAQRRFAAKFDRAQHFTDEDLEIGLSELRRLLAGLRCMVIADDLWEMDTFRGIDAVRPPGRLVFTTRDREIVRGANGAVPLEVLALNLDQARAVLAGWVKLEPGFLPPRADALCLAAGNLPLAVAMIGALVYADGGSAQWGPAWEGVLEHLRQHDLEAIGQKFGNYDHATLLRAVQVSIESLTPAERRRYFDLAAFAGQGPVPSSVAEALWAPVGLTPAAIRTMIRQLADRSLLRRDAGNRISLHDLQFDVAEHYLAEQPSGVAGAHAQLLTGYQTRLQGLTEFRPGTSSFFSYLARHLVEAPPGSPVWVASNDRYLLDHLAYHLAAAGRREELSELLTSFAWLDLGLWVRELTGLLADFTHTMGPGVPTDENPTIVHQSLQMSAHVLAEDTTQLPGQVIGRLFSHPAPVIQRLLSDAKNWTHGQWLAPRRQSLVGPGGPLRYTLLHPDEVTAIAMASNGERVITATPDGVARVWNLAVGACEHLLAGHTERVFTVAISPDGDRAITGSSDRTARTWNLISGRCEHLLAGHTGIVRAAVISADGSHAVTASADSTARVWNLATGACEHILAGHMGGVFTVTMSLDGNRALTGSTDGTGRVWNIVTGACEHVLVGHADEVSTVAINADGSQAVTASADGMARMWNLATGVCEHQVTDQNSAMVAVAVIAGQPSAISGSDDGTARVWNLATGACEHLLDGHTGEVRAAMISANGSRAVTGSRDSTGRVWNLTDGACEHRLTGHSGSVTRVAICADGSRAVSSSDDRAARVWDLTIRSGEPQLIGHNGMVEAVAVSVDGSRAITGARDREARVWDLATGACLHRLTGHTGPVHVVAVSADGVLAVTGSDDGEARVWDLATGACVHRLTGDTGPVNVMAVSADGVLAVTGSDDDEARVWDLASGACVHHLTGHIRQVDAVAITPDGTRAATGSTDGTVRVWDLASGACTQQLDTRTEYVGTVAISMDGSRVAASSGSYTAWFWDLTASPRSARWTTSAFIGPLAATQDLTVLVYGDETGGIHILEPRGI
jgi:WD40 repeat protein